MAVYKIHINKKLTASNTNDNHANGEHSMQSRVCMTAKRGYDYLAFTHALSVKWPVNLRGVIDICICIDR